MPNEHETHRRHDAAERGDVAPAHRLAEHHDHEYAKHRERDRFLRDLELTRGPSSRIADPVGGNGQRIFDSGKHPADQENPCQRPSLGDGRATLEMPIPGSGHEDV